MTFQAHPSEFVSMARDQLQEWRYSLLIQGIHSPSFKAQLMSQSSCLLKD